MASGCGSCNNNSSSSCGSVVGCATTLSANCVFYQGGYTLDQLGGTTTNRLEQLLININEKFKSLTEQVQDGFIGVNVGGGVEVYKGLNADGIGELRTFRSSESILITSDDNTITVAIRESYINGLLDPIKGDITSLQTQIDNLVSQYEGINNRLTTLENNYTSITNEVADLYTKYNNLQEQYNNLREEFTILNQNFLTLQNRMDSVENTINEYNERITNIENIVNEVVSKAGITTAEEFVGSSVMTLRNNPTTVIGVYHNGILLPFANWIFESPNVVTINLNSLEMTLKDTDKLVVQYTYVNSTTADSLLKVREELVKFALLATASKEEE